MHDHTPEIAALAQRILDQSRARIALDPVPLGSPRSEAQLQAACGQTITADGMGGQAALDLFVDVLEPASLSVDYARYLSFVPAAPSEASVLFDLIVGASSIYGGSWIEGAGAVFAENQALAWLSELAGLPEGAGGVFVQGGTLGNLSALVAAREDAQRRRGSRPDRWAFVASEEAHSSVKSAAKVMDADVILAPTNDRFQMTGEGVRDILATEGHRVAAVIATSGTTNLGVIDELRSIGEACQEAQTWLHVDGAYGGAALASSRTHSLFDGLELADSFIVDPHKWLFAPFDCCALLYRDPETARHAHAQHAGYLAFLDEWGDWNPSDFAIHLTRRVRGLPFWFSLAMHGTRAYEAAIDVTLDLTDSARTMIDQAPHLRLVMEPQLSVVAFERIGWSAQQYQDWSVQTMHDGVAFVVPSRHQKQPVFRFCFVNPKTTTEDIAAVIERLEHPA